MKKILIVAACLAIASGVYAEMKITGTVDGPLSGGLPKAIELYTDIPIADLSVYGVESANNGGGTNGPEYVLSGSATAGQFLYVASETNQFNVFFGFKPDFADSVANINGDDAIVLYKNGEIIDVFGDVNTDGTGQPWEYLDGWAYRNNGTGPDGFVWTIGNWSFSGPNALDGETSNATAATPFPIGTYVIPEPALFGLLPILVLFFRRK
jgi:hypothetical protein